MKTWRANQSAGSRQRDLAGRGSLPAAPSAAAGEPSRRRMPRWQPNTSGVLFSRLRSRLRLHSYGALRGLALFVAVACSPLQAVEITEATYEDRPHFKIATRSATYWFDRKGGGFSRIIDVDGNDWIGFRSDPPITQVPACAGSSARGLPNAVYRGDDNGVGHPGFDRCHTRISGSRSITTVSESGKWQWTWVFSKDGACGTVDRIDPARSYWFLYEGTIAGSFAPRKKYWGADTGGPRYEAPNHLQGEAVRESWRWVYFGDREVPRVFFLAQVPADIVMDNLSFMGNSRGPLDEVSDGMVVFGFGRGPRTTPLLTEARLKFVIGFLERGVPDAAGHAAAAATIEKVVGSLGSRRGCRMTAVDATGPAPEDPF